MTKLEKQFFFECGDGSSEARRSGTSPVTPACVTRLLLLLFLFLPAAVQAQDYTYTTNDGAITITGYTGPGGDVIIPDRIPDTIDGLPVTSIGDSAFFFIASLNSITIPNNVTNIGRDAFRFSGLTSLTILDSATSIGGWAFHYCNLLTNVTLGNNITSIGEQAFANCTSLSSIALPDSLSSIALSTFLYCSALTNASIPNSVTNIGEWAFANCYSLPSITVPNNFARVGNFAFFHCNSLTNVSIPSGVVSIGVQAFDGCSSLTNVVIPDSVTEIGANAFYRCSSLATITVEAGNSVYSTFNGVLLDKSQTTIIECPAGLPGDYTVPGLVNRIIQEAFSLCVKLTNVIISSSVANIETYAFNGCANLTGVYFRGHAPKIGESIFLNDNNLTVYYLPGTTNWGATFAGRPTTVWALPYPIVLNIGPSFGVQPSGFGFTISWATNIPVMTEASTNLANPLWLPVGTNTLTNGSSYFHDSGWTNYPGRFYRLRSP